MLQSCPKRRIRIATRQCPCVTSLAMSKQDLFQQVKTEQVSSEKELEWIKKELQERTIRFGKTHCGKKFHTLAHSEPQYCTWFTFRWGESTKEEHREFLHFLNMYRAHGEVDGDSSSQRKTRALSGNGLAQSQSFKQEASGTFTGQWQAPIHRSEKRARASQNSPKFKWPFINLSEWIKW